MATTTTTTISATAASLLVGAVITAALAALTLARANRVLLFNRRIDHPSVRNSEFAALFLLAAVAAAIDALRYSLHLADAPRPSLDQPSPSLHSLSAQTPVPVSPSSSIVGPHIIDAWLLMASATLRCACVLALSLALNQQRWYRSRQIDPSTHSFSHSISRSSSLTSPFSFRPPSFLTPTTASAPTTGRRIMPLAGDPAVDSSLSAPSAAPPTLAGRSVRTRHHPGPQHHQHTHPHENTTDEVDNAADDPTTPLLENQRTTYGVQSTPGGWPHSGVTARFPTHPSGHPTQLPLGSVSSPALLIGHQENTLSANPAAASANPPVQSTDTSSISIAISPNTRAAPAMPSTSGSRTFGTGPSGPRGSRVSRRSSRSSFGRNQDTFHDAIAGIGNNLAQDDIISEEDDEDQHNEDDDLLDRESDTDGPDSIGTYTICCCYSVPRSIISKARDHIRKFIRKVFFSWEFVFVLLFLIRVGGLMFAADPTAFAEQLPGTPTAGVSDAARLAINVTLGIIQIIPLFVLAIAIAIGGSCAPARFPESARSRNINNPIGSQPQSPQQQQQQQLLQRRRRRQQHGPSVLTKFLFLLGVTLTTLWWIEPSLLSRAINSWALSDSPSMTEYESRVCVVPPWWWVEVRPNTTIATPSVSGAYPGSLRVHGWASWMDMVLWAVFVGFWAIFSAMRAEFKRNMEEWVWLTVSRVQNTFGFRR